MTANIHVNNILAAAASQDKMLKLLVAIVTKVRCYTCEVDIKQMLTLG
jgi:hypothetical protein